MSTQYGDGGESGLAGAHQTEKSAPSPGETPSEHSSTFTHAAHTANTAAEDDQTEQKSEGHVSQAENVSVVAAHEEEDFPEGTLRGWLSVVGASLSMFVTFGYLNSFGIYQDYYQNNFLSDYPASTIAWIGSMQYLLIFSCGAFVGRLFDAGYFYQLFTIFAILLIVFQMLLSLCTQYYQFFLCQGIGIGLCFGLLMNLTVGVPAHWFRKKRATAMGFMAAGSSIGGIVFPITVDRLSVRIGFPWTMRVVGFIILFCLAIARLTIRTRLPPNKAAIKGVTFKAFLNLRLFLDLPSYAFFVLGAFLISFAIYTPFTYITSFASYYPRIDPTIGPYLLPIINAASTFGRIGPAYLADAFGRINIVVPCLFLTGILILIWPLCTTTASVIVFAIIFGFFSGVYVSLIPACASQLCPTAIVGQVLGLMFFFLGFACAFGPPISGALLSTAGGNNYWAAAGYAGALTIVGTGAICIGRHLALKGKLRGKI